MLEATDRVIQEEPCGRVLNLLVESLYKLSVDSSPLVLAGFLLKLCSIAGFAPSLERCAECGGPAAWFSPGQGGAVCPGCRSFDAEEVGPVPLELMSDLLRDAPSEPSAIDELMACRLARFYAEYHLERRLKSAAAVETLARF
jgi:DNA repair protein RecO (recombination protein O)